MTECNECSRSFEYPGTLGKPPVIRDDSRSEFAAGAKPCSGRCRGNVTRDPIGWTTETRSVRVESSFTCPPTIGAKIRIVGDVRKRRVEKPSPKRSNTDVRTLRAKPIRRRRENRSSTTKHACREIRTELADGHAKTRRNSRGRRRTFRIRFALPTGSSCRRYRVRARDSIGRSVKRARHCSTTFIERRTSVPLAHARAFKRVATT